MRLLRLAANPLLAVSVVVVAVAAAARFGSMEGEITIDETVAAIGGSPVAGTVVETMFPLGTHATATTDASGRCQLLIVPGTISMHVRAPAAARLVDGYADIGFREASFTQDFQLQLGYLVSGAVKLPDGTAAASGLEMVPSPISFAAAATSTDA